jgi:hypothetical protein
MMIMIIIIIIRRRRRRRRRRKKKKQQTLLRPCRVFPVNISVLVWMEWKKKQHKLRWSYSLLAGFRKISGPENENFYFMSTSSVRVTELEDKTLHCLVEWIKNLEV